MVSMLGNILDFGRITKNNSESGYSRHPKQDFLIEKRKMQKEINHEHSHYSDSHSSRKKENVNDTKRDKDHDHKQDVTKSAVSVFGDWSEHISSSGKRYYYNCKTEVSQWEKPKEWVKHKSDTRSRDGDRHHDGQRKSHMHESKHRHSDSDERSNSYQSSNARAKDYRRAGHGPFGSPQHKKANGGESTYNSDGKRNKRGHHTDNYYNRNRKEQFSNRYHTEQYNCDRPVNPRLGNVSGNVTSSGMHPAGPRDLHTTVPSRNKNQSEDKRHTEDMDISPGNTPNSSPGFSRSSSQFNSQLASHTSSQQDGTPSSSHVTSSFLQGDKHDKRMNCSDSQKLTQQAIATLQKLQEAISSTLKYDQKREQPQVTVQQSPRCHEVSQVTSPAQQFTEVTLPSGTPEEKPRAESPKSEGNVHITRNGSPAHSEGSSQGEDSSPNCVNMTPGIKPPTVQMTPSLTNYYNNDLTVHLSGWPADRVEVDANQCGEEGTTVGNLHCTQVSADLKTARSLVRVAEIQATLYEQRILLIKQEIKDLGNLRTQNLSAEDP